MSMRIRTITTKRIRVAIVIGSVFAILNGSSFGDRSRDEEVERAIKDWRSITPEMLSNPANKAWVERLKSRALKRGEIEAAIPFLNSGDDDVIKNWVIIFRKGRRYDAQPILQRCAQPKAIVQVADDLMIDENAEVKWRDDLGTTPQSTATAELIQKIIINSPQFNKPVKNWAISWYRANRTEFRTAMRVWWKENGDLLKAGKYGDVKPPRDYIPRPGPPPATPFE